MSINGSSQFVHAESSIPQLSNRFHPDRLRFAESPILPTQIPGYYSNLTGDTDWHYPQIVDVEFVKQHMAIPEPADA
jgi:hypothetical protein